MQRRRLRDRRGDPSSQPGPGGSVPSTCALSDIPDDALKIYDHTHRGCRTLQYASAKLAHQLGDTVIRIDTTGVLGGDSRPC
jgi:hypothetical protein